MRPSQSLRCKTYLLILLMVLGAMMTVFLTEVENVLTKLAPT